MLGKRFGFVIYSTSYHTDISVAFIEHCRKLLVDYSLTKILVCDGK